MNLIGRRRILRCTSLPAAALYSRRCKFRSICHNRSYMNKSEMIDKIAAEYDLTKVKAKAVVEQVFGFIGADLKKEGRFAFPDLGTFTVGQRAARKGRNPA